jgi:YD repeat-containing protein
MKISQRSLRNFLRVFILFAGLLCAKTLFAANGSVVYTYDALGRVLSASYDTGVIVIYTYDANGNRTQQVINVNTATLTWTATATPCTANCWGAALW